MQKVSRKKQSKVKVKVKVDESRYRVYNIKKTNYIFFEQLQIFCSIFLMLFINIFNYKSYFFPVLLKCMILILRSSPELLLNKYQTQHNHAEQITFLFTIIEGTLNFRIIITTLSNFLYHSVTFSFLLCIGSIFVYKTGIFGFQIISNLLFPIQVYLTVFSINNDSLSKGQIVGFGILSIISFVIVLSKFFVFDFRTDSAVIVKAFGKSFQVLSQLIMVLSGLMSFFLDDNTKVAILLVLLGLNLVKTYILYYYINFESPLIEYTVYLCDPLSWISLLTSFLSLAYGINTSWLIWGYFCLIIAGIFFENSVLRYLIEKKYIYFFRKQFNINSNRNKQKIDDIQENLIIYLSLVKIGLKLKDKAVAKESFLRFSEQFVHEVCTSIIHLEEVFLKKSQQFNRNTSAGQSSEKGFDINALKNKQFKFENQHEYAQKYWDIIKQMKELQDERFNKLRRYVIYTLPQINNAFQARIVYIYYLSHQKESKQKKGGKLRSRLHFIDDLHQSIDYNFVVEQIKNREIERVLVQSKKNAQGQIIISEKSESSYCLNIELAYGSSFFEEFYIQTVYQQTLQTKFKQFYDTQKQIIAIVESVHSTVDSLTSKLLKINKIKQKIFTIIEECPQIQSKQFILQQFILSKYILRLPFSAREKLKLLEEESDEKKMKQRLVMDSQKTTTKTFERVQLENNQGILLVSAVKNKGNIIYGPNNIRQILEIKSGLNLTSQDNHQMVHINHLLLPCWIEQHNEVMDSLMIYEKPFHHLGNKYHIKSIISKNIYEVQFTMHFITCNMNDLIIAMNLKYKHVETLSISKNGERIFSYSSKQNRMDRQNSILGHLIRLEENNQNDNFLSQRFEYNHKKRVRTFEESIFNQKYQIVTRYPQQMDDEISAVESVTFSSYIQESQSYAIQAGQPSVWNFKNDKEEKRISIQKKLNHYRKNKFLYMKDYVSIVLIVIFLCIFLIVTAAALTKLLLVQGDSHKHMVQNQYFLTDLKSFNSFLMLFVPLTPYIKFPSNASILDFQTVWEKIFVEEINNLKTRGTSLSSNTYDSNFALQLSFTTLNNQTTTFFFQEEKFDVQYFNIFDQLNLSSIDANGTSTAVFPNPFTALNSAQQATLNTLYLESLSRYNEYLQTDGVFPTIIAKAAELIDEENTKLRIIYTFIVVILFIGMISFVVLYIRYLNNLNQFTSALFEFPDQTFISLQMELQEFKNFTASKKAISTDYNVGRTMKSCQTISIKNKSVFIRKSEKNKVIKEIKKFSSLRSNWKEIVLLSIFVLLFLVLLYESYLQSNAQMSLFMNFMSGTAQLTQTSAKSINIFSWLMDATFYIDHPVNSQIFFLVDQLKRVDLLKTMQILQPNPNDLELSLFSSWYDTGYLKINFFDTLQAKRTLMESFTKSIQLYEIVYTKLSTQQRGIPIDSKLVIQMYKEISHSTQMIRELLNKSQTNYFDSIPRANIFLILSIIANLVFTTLILYWIHTHLYNKTKIIFEETLSFTTIKDLLHVPRLAYHLHESDKQNLFDSSGKDFN